jgi:hypothetical protein
VAHAIEAGLPGYTEGHHNYRFPDKPFFRELPPNEPADLCVETTVVAGEGAARGHSYSRGAFDLLMELARDERRPLRRCGMPRGSLTQRLDRLLGVRPDDAPDCGRFYIAERIGEDRGGRNCGEPTCKKYHARLAEDVLPSTLRLVCADTDGSPTWDDCVPQFLEWGGGRPGRSASGLSPLTATGSASGRPRSLSAA